MSLLAVKEIHKSFGGLHAVDAVSFAVEQGSIHALIGPNGAGKTTLFNLISGTLTADCGEVLFRDTTINGLPPQRIAALGIARTFQNIELFAHMTVMENVLVGRHRKGRAGFVAALCNLPAARREEKALREACLAVLDQLGISDLAGHQAGSLPFGRQRMVEFARALALEPELLLLDEPAAGLNIHETGEIARLITMIRDQGITVVIIEHDMSLIMDISDQVVVLSSGRTIAAGPPRQIQRDPEVIKTYLGEDDAAHS